MSIFNSLLQKTSSVKRVCILFIGSHLVILSMMLFTFPVINNQIGTKAFDMQSFGYSVSTAESIVNNLNTQTTDLYLFPQLALLDVLYPFLLALFLSSFIFRLFLITKTKNKANSILLIVPFLAMGFDYLENTCIILMISKSIEISESFVLISSSFTVLKGTLTSIAWLTILIYSIKWLILRINEKKNKQPLSKPKLH
jgi:hypothetical protein